MIQMLLIHLPQTEVMNIMIDAYMMRVDQEAGLVYQGYISKIDNTLEAMQSYVGGYIEAVTIAEGIVLICDEDGKMKGYMPNRAWVKGDRILDIIVGDIMFVRSEGDEFESIRQEDIAVIEELFRPIEYVRDTFVKVKNVDELPEYKEYDMKDRDGNAD